MQNIRISEVYILNVMREALDLHKYTVEMGDQGKI